MTMWLYVGCDITQLPEDIQKNSKELSPDQIKQIIKSVPIIEGEMEAYNVDAVASLLMDDGIFPLKIHPVMKSETGLGRLKALSKNLRSIKNNRPPGGDLKG